MEQIIFKKISEIQFNIYSPSLIKKMSAAKIVTPELYDAEGYPVDGGLMDLRLGVIDPGLRCKTCGGKIEECTGHFGYIELARPVIHIKFVDEIKMLLQSTCHVCGKALMREADITRMINELNQIEKTIGLHAKKAKINEIISKLRTVKKCPHCGAEQTKIKLEKPTTFLENDKKLSKIEIRSRLERIPDKHCKLFGINPQSFRPEWAVLTVLLIPPVTIRPSITLESGERSEDDLTHKLADIVRINQRLFEQINAGSPELIIDDLWDLLEYHITTFFDNTSAKVPPARHRAGGKPLKTLTERIKSKEGRIRYNLSGKRTNFSARTVISPDPKIQLNEVGVPFVVAKKLTIPERVNKLNIDYLRGFIERGPNNYPGANYVIRPDGRRKRITEETKEQILEELQPGYVVERHLMDGDVVLFNRQPTLHRMSIMSHKVKVLPYKTFRINPAVCAPYNADFDGDEMNLHVPQTEEARAEAELLMEVPSQIISPKHGLSVIGSLQSAITGTYLLTRDVKMSYKEAVSLLIESIGDVDLSKLPKKDMVDGKEIYSVIIPKGFNYIGKTKQKEPLIIENGYLKEGVIDKASLGEGAGMLLRKMHKEYGAKQVIKFIFDSMKLGNTFLRLNGFTISLGDLDLDENVESLINQELENSYKQVDDVIALFNQGKLDALPGRTEKETLEMNILKILNDARNKISDLIVKNTNKETQLMVMINSGGRGNLLNLAQMSGCVGQQALRGNRISKGYKHRTLSSFKENDLNPEAHGFIKRGFKQGLTPQEFFFMAITGRDSLMDTALRTPKSGYLYRRLSNALQDIKVEYDKTVRDSGTKIIQYIYGDDNIDVSKSEAGDINISRIVEEVINEK